MNSAGELYSRDLQALVSLVEESRSDDPGPMVPWALLEGLASLIPAEEVSICDLDVRLEMQESGQGILDLSEKSVDIPAPADQTADELFWRYQEDFWPAVPLARAGVVYRWSDWYTPRELREQPLYAEFYGPLGVRHLMSLGLPTPTGHARNILFFRSSGTDFSEREKQMVQLLRPHLCEIYDDAARRRQGIPRLTKREWEVLRLVAAGHSNAGIAGILFTSVSTVRKHLEHIFDRTGVRSRTLAVARMMPTSSEIADRYSAGSTGTPHHMT